MTHLPDIEKKLQSLAPTANGFDKSGVKARLFTSIQNQPAHELKVRVPSPYYRYLQFASVGLASVMFLFVGSAYASLSALPGEPLYSMKVHVTEEMIALTKISPEASFAYSIERLELRASELNTIQAQGVEISAEVAAVVASEVADEVAVLESISSNEQIPDTSEQYLTQLAKAKHVIEEQAIALTGIQVSPEVQSITESQEIIDATLVAAVEEYVDTTASSTVTTFVAEQVATIDDVLLSTTTPEHVKSEGSAVLEDMYASLEAEDLSDAVLKTFDLLEITDAIIPTVE